MTWPCEAYGEDSIAVGALCFFSSESHHRVCDIPETCNFNMNVERRRLWRRLNELAAQGDELGIEMVASFTGPEELLGGKKD